MQNAMYYKSVLGLLLLSGLISGCATTADNPDPFEKFNRGVYAFNDGIDKVVLKPVAETYKAITPEPVDKGVTNFFSNLDDVIVVANDLLQLKFKQAASDAGRLLLNSTVGLLGFVDVASEFYLPKHEEDFGQTLGYWGIGSGPYLVLPFLGPSSVRDTVGRGADFFLDPRTYATGEKVRYVIIGTGGVKAIDTRADLFGAEKILDAAALDKYSYIRDAYLARRNYLVYDGDPPQDDDDDDDFFDDEDDEEDDEEDEEGNDDEDDGDNEGDDEEEDEEGDDDEDDGDNDRDDDEEDDDEEDEEGDDDEDDDETSNDEAAS